ncbi:MAG: DUF2157 domain-containing protein [Thermoanaerobaculia bacterium]
MKQRIVIYLAGRFASDGELLDEIEAVTGANRDSVAKLLKTRRAVFLNELDETGANRISNLLEARGADFDLEDSTPAPDKSEWLAGEIPKWVKRGLVGPAQAASLYRNYGLEPPVTTAPAKPAADPRTLVRAVLTLGAVLIGLGVILFVASNWEKIPDAAKIAGSLVLTLAALFLADRLESAGKPRSAATSYLVALFGIGGVLLLIAQTYHIVADSYLLPLVWGGLCVPVGLLQRFKPALYIASGLWLWSYWLHVEPNDHLLWAYPVLLLGFLLPYGIATKDKVFIHVHLGVLMLAMASTVPTEDFWLCSAWLAALVVLKILCRKPLYDWLLLGGSVIWLFAFLIAYDDIPNYFYAVAAGYFVYRAWRERSNALMIGAIANAWLWFLVLHVAVSDRLRFEILPTGVLLWILSTGLLLYGIGARFGSRQGWLPTARTASYGSGLLGALMVYILSFRFYSDESAFFASKVLLTSAVALGAVGVVLAVPRILTALRSGRWGPLAVIGLTALSLASALFVSPGTGFQVVLFNLILFVLALALMLHGHRTGHPLWYNAGIALFVVLIVSRYFDTFVDLLPRSVFFLLGGVFLIAWAILVDRQRRRRLAQGATPGGEVGDG